LVVPGVNDTDAELQDIARFLARASRDVPWHVTAFHKDYKMTDPDDTPAKTLLRAARIGKAEGLRYVYAGNLPGLLGGWEDTACPSCGETLVERLGFQVLSNRLKDGRCPACAAPAAGRWDEGCWSTAPRPAPPGTPRA
ncbi:MAG: hypothetical protein KGL53_06535, partial [Elusimicrobia bacterium]|nr:hypothetical protein [Elusimicrobiota bacterium]